MKKSIRDRLKQIENRYTEIENKLSSMVDINPEELKTLGKEQAELAPLSNLFHEYCQLEEEEADAAELFNDADLKEIAYEEHARIQLKKEQIEEDITKGLLPKDPDDEGSLFLEIRAGTGGDESALFAGMLFRMYSRFSEKYHWKIEIISSNESELGGLREIICRVVGKGAYGKLKFESGGHRVQRVPTTESKGRVHTSACTVAILPEAKDIGDIEIDPSQLRIDTYRASGAGGQHVNKTDSAVRITHLPSGLVVECQDDRSQHRNKAQAMSILAARLKDLKQQEQDQKMADTRRSLIGSGDRSERIRTYNFPQGRITDHRINLTLYKIDVMMEGELDELIEALSSEHQANLLAELSEE